MFYTKNGGNKMSNLIEKKIDSTSIYDGIIVKLFKDTVELPNGKEAYREVIRHPGAVCVIPITDDGDVVFVRQFRYPFNDEILELPAGKLDIGELPIDAAKRELSEETGVISSTLIPLGRFYSTPAIIDEVIYIYLATNLKFGEQSLDEDEFLEIERIPFSEAIDMVINDKLPDGKTQVGILKAKHYFEKNRN